MKLPETPLKILLHCYTNSPRFTHSRPSLVEATGMEKSGVCKWFKKMLATGIFYPADKALYRKFHSVDLYYFNENKVKEFVELEEYNPPASPKPVDLPVDCNPPAIGKPVDELVDELVDRTTTNTSNSNPVSNPVNDPGSNPVNSNTDEVIVLMRNGVKPKEFIIPDTGTYKRPARAVIDKGMDPDV